MHDPYSLPTGLPVPKNDGAADHLVRLEVPALTLSSSQGAINLRELCAVRAVVYIYPRTGRPGVAPPTGWDAIPGARGCTPQSCSFRDHAAELATNGALVAGLSAQPVEEQLEFAARNQIPYPVVADPDLLLREALDLPVFDVAGLTLYKRLTFVAQQGRIAKVFYPVFPPDRNAERVLEYLAMPS